MKSVLRVIAVFSVTAMVFLAGCFGPGHRMNNLAIGMTKQEALKVMGTPSSTASPGQGMEVLRYIEVKTVQGVSFVNEYYIKLIDNHVESYGKVGDFGSTQDPTLNLNVQNR